MNDESRSSWVSASFVVPRCSVLGPLPYLLYRPTVQLALLGLVNTLFANDVQAYLYSHRRAGFENRPNPDVGLVTHSFFGWPQTASCLLHLRFRPSGLVDAGNLQRLTFRGSPLSSVTYFGAWPSRHPWSWAQFLSSHKIGCTELQLTAMPTSACFSHPRPCICN